MSITWGLVYSRHQNTPHSDDGKSVTYLIQIILHKMLT